MRKWLWIILLPVAVFAQDWNSFQTTRPRGENYRRRIYTPPATVPNAPISLTATQVSSSQIDLAWVNSDPLLGGNIVQRCQGASCSDFSTVQDLTPAQEAWSDTTGIPSTSYSYRVAAYKLGRTSAWSSTATASTAAVATPTPTPTATATPTATPTPPAGAPAAPSGLNATAVSTTEIDLTWLDNASNELGFHVNRCTGSSCSNFTQAYEIATPNTQSKADTGLTANTIYCYNVTAYNAAGDSAASGEAGDQTFTPTPTPTATPTNTPTPTPTPTPGGSCAGSEVLTGAAAAWCLTEGSGNVTDSVASIALTAYGTSTYNVQASTPWDGYSPGVTVSTGQGFYNSSTQSAMNIGTGSANFMWVAKKDAVSASGVNVVFTQDGAYAKGVSCYWYNSSFERIECDIMNTAVDYSYCIWNTSTTQSIPGDGAYHKYELRLDRTAATMNLYIDDAVQGAGCGTSAIAGDSLTNTGFILGMGDNAGGSPYLGTILFLRMKLTAQ